jgi:DNA polymerase-3 subunit alpha
VRVAGMVAFMHPILTRDGQTSLAVVLEDIDGKIEVMVWARVYNQTKDVWQDGNILLVEGKVRERADQMQIVCERVSRYDLETPAASGTVAALNSNHVEKKNHMKDTPISADTSEKPSELKRLIVIMHQSADANTDVAQLHRVMQVLRDYPGSDEVALSVSNGVTVFKLKMGQTRVGCCQELLRRVAEIVGEDGVRVENLLKDNKNGGAIS